MRSSTLLVVLATAAFGACQKYPFAYQANNLRQGVHLRFTVEQPSKADLLFVIDTSGSMGPRQAALKSSIAQLLAVLAPQHTSYRIGITSTDAYGAIWNCQGNPAVNDPGMNPKWLPGALGNCQRPEVLLRRPHDGTVGRLMAAYDPAEFDTAGSVLSRILTTDTQRAAFTSIAPTDVDKGPVGLAGEQGVPWVIDRDLIQAESCKACQAVDPACASAPDGALASCDADSACFGACAGPVATGLVTSYFRSSVNGLGIDGTSYEMGLLAGLRAVGIDAEHINDLSAISPDNDLTLPGGPNSFTVLDADGQPIVEPWLRPDAMLAIMLVSDEEDCSAPSSFFGSALMRSFEVNANPPMPSSSVCYMRGQNGLADVVDRYMLDPHRMAHLLALKKGAAARVAIGVIAALKQKGATLRPDEAAVGADCVSTDRAPLDPTGQPSSDCSCSAPEPPLMYNEWCQVTDDTSGPDGIISCDGRAGRRYVNFANQFPSRTFDSICRSGSPCETDLDCWTAGGLVCIGNHCGRPCSHSSDCGALSSCIEGECLRSCTTTSDCDSGRSCVRGTCVAGFGAALARFASIASSDCFVIDPSITPANSDPANIQVVRTPPGGTPGNLPLVDPSSGNVGWWYDATSNRVCLSGIERSAGDAYDVFVLTTSVTEAGS